MIVFIDSAWLNVLELFSDANREVFLKSPKLLDLGCALFGKSIYLQQGREFICG